MTRALRIILAGGSGQVGKLLARRFCEQKHDVLVLTRHSAPKADASKAWREEHWDGETVGEWVQHLENADVLINLCGRSVNCRYTVANRKAIMDSRVGTTKLLGEAISRSKHPPRLWMNASTATIYRHALDRPMDEDTGEFGGSEAGAPDTWAFSIEVAKNWEDAFFSSTTMRTRKVALRSAMVMSPTPGGIFGELLRLVRLGLGGTAGSGEQFVSWIHGEDFFRSVEYLIGHEEMRGPVNLCSPNPIPNREFMRILRKAWAMPIGLPTARWMLGMGAVFLRTETELILKSRRVVPDRLLQSGFRFRFPDWNVAAEELVGRWRSGRIVRANMMGRAGLGT